MLQSIKYVLFDWLEIRIEQNGVKAVAIIAHEISPAMSFTLVKIAVLGLTEGAGSTQPSNPPASGRSRNSPK